MSTHFNKMHDEWLEMQLTQSGGFAGLSRKATLVKADVHHDLVSQTKEALKILLKQSVNASSVNASSVNQKNYPDQQQLHIEVKTPTGQWAQTLNGDELSPELMAICQRLDWKPV
jgi:hypothetical protein